MTIILGVYSDNLFDDVSLDKQGDSFMKVRKTVKISDHFLEISRISIHSFGLHEPKDMKKRKMGKKKKKTIVDFFQSHYLAILKNIS